MENQINYYASPDGRKLINARELHVLLRSKRHFANWILYKINKLGLIKNKDYVVFNKNVNNPQGGRPIIEYGLTNEVAERVALEENNEAGMQIRNQLVKQRELIREMYNKIPKTRPEMLRLLADHEERIEIQETEIKELRPKAEFTEKFLEADSLFTISETAKALNITGIGRNLLYAHLRDWGILFKNRNEPRQEFINRGYFRYVPYKQFKLGDGTKASKSRTMVYPKGIEFIARKYGMISPVNLKLSN